MFQHALLLMLAGTMPTTPSVVQTPPSVVAGVQARAEAEAGRRLPPPPQAVRDTVDVLYRQARDLMARGEHARAAEFFRTIAARHPESDYAPDAPYWEAFNLYRLEGEPAVRGALDALQRQASRYPDAASRRNGDAQALQTRLLGLLASLGDESSARAVRQVAQERSCAEEDLETRTAALNALVRIGPGEALPILREVMEREDACGLELRRRVPYLLSRLDSPEAADLLIEIARSDTDPETRRSAVSYLGRLDAEAATDLLLEIARSDADPELRRDAISALGRDRGLFVTGRTGEMFGVPLVTVGRPGEPGGPPLGRVVPYSGQSGRAFGVTVRGQPAPADEDPRVLQLFRDLASDASNPMDLRETAVRQLSRRNPPELVPFLDAIFDRTPELRGSIVRAISDSSSPEAMEWLLEVAADGSFDEDVRKSAVYRAGRRDDQLELYLSLYPRLEGVELKKSFLMGLAEREDPQAVDLLIRVAREEQDPELRQSAIYWLARSGDPRVAGVLREIIGG